MEYVAGTLYFLGAFMTYKYIEEVRLNRPKLLSHCAILLWPVTAILGVVVNIMYYYED